MDGATRTDICQGALGKAGTLPNCFHCYYSAIQLLEDRRGEPGLNLVEGQSEECDRSHRRVTDGNGLKQSQQSIPVTAHCLRCYLPDTALHL